MTEQRTTETRDPDGNTHTHTTVISDEPKKGGGTWVFLLIVLLVVVVGIVAFTQLGGAEIAKDNAVAEAANEVGDAAQQVGDAAQEVTDEVTGSE